MGTMTNITWKDFFEEATVPPVGDDDAVSATSGNLGPAGAANVDFGKVRVRVGKVGGRVVGVVDLE